MNSKNNNSKILALLALILLAAMVLFRVTSHTASKNPNVSVRIENDTVLSDVKKDDDIEANALDANDSDDTKKNNDEQQNNASEKTPSTGLVVTYYAENANSTVFQELLDYGNKNNIEVKYNNNYEFGAFIENIGKAKNGDGGKYWQYYVNGKLGEVASDKKILNVGDVIEWRFENVPF